MRIYALGALSRYGDDCTVQMTIVQPRGWHKDGHIDHIPYQLLI